MFAIYLACFLLELEAELVVCLVVVLVSPMSLDILVSTMDLYFSITIMMWGDNNTNLHGGCMNMMIYIVLVIFGVINQGMIVVRSDSISCWQQIWIFYCPGHV